MQEQLRAQVPRRPAAADALRALDAQAQVDNFDSLVLIQKDVVRLDVAMNDAEGMHKLQDLQRLLNDHLDVSLLKFAPLLLCSVKSILSTCESHSPGSVPSPTPSPDRRCFDPSYTRRTV